MIIMGNKSANILKAHPMYPADGIIINCFFENVYFELFFGFTG